jgi:hypothetical protein
MSSRAKRGICFFANPEKKADSSGKRRPRNDTFGFFRILLQNQLRNAVGYEEGTFSVEMSRCRFGKNIAAKVGAVYI